MGDNATVVVKSKCIDCKQFIQLIQSGTNDWNVKCRKYGTVKPRMKCKGCE